MAILLVLVEPVCSLSLHGPLVIQCEYFLQVPGFFLPVPATDM